MIHLKTFRLVCIFVALLAVFAVRTARATTTPSAIQCGKWNVVASPSIILGVSQLNAVAAVSADDVWAVGDSDSLSQTLIEQWNNSNWQIVASPSVNTYNALYGVTALSAQNVWAVGYSGDINDNNQTLIEHWDGSQWSVISSPNYAGTQNDILTGVSAVSATDIWAVGYYGTAAYTTQHTLTEHWDGTQWSIVKSPAINKNSQDSTELYGVSAIATNDVWAVGTDNIGSHAVILHWDGSRWKLSSHPNLETQLYAVAGISARDAWAVGSSVGAQTLTDYWNGKSWHIIVSPTPHGINTLAGVAASGASNFWAVGWDEVAQGDKPDTEHWNGTQWKLVASPNLNHGGQLFAVTIASSSQVWSVGSYALNKNRTVFDPLIEYYC